MPSAQDHNRRIARNTLILYARMLVMMLIGLYTSRVVLQVLGVDDYGIYNAVGGFVAMFSLLSSTLTMATNRFLAYELGGGDVLRLQRVFATSLNVMLILAAVILLIGLTAGLWFLNTHMVIPPGRMAAANVVLVCTLLSFTIGVTAVPYNAAIVAHERMSAFAYISLVEASAKLAGVYVLFVIPADKLMVYAGLLLIIQVAVRLLYMVYCKRHFAECTYHPVFDRRLFRGMLSFTGWTFIGSSAATLNYTGVNVLLNLFFGVTVNAARGIASVVSTCVYNLVSNFIMAVEPRIIKSYAQGDYAYMHSLVCRGAKFSYFLMLLFLIPICIEAPRVLLLWLGQVPPYTVLFVRLALMTAILNTLSLTLITAVQATGVLKRFQMVTGLVEILCFPLTYAAFLLGAPPEAAYHIYLVVYAVLTVLRLYLVKDLIHMPAAMFVTGVYGRIIIVTAVSVAVPLAVRLAMPTDTLLRFVLTCALSLVTTAAVCYTLGLTTPERRAIRNMIKEKLSTPNS